MIVSRKNCNGSWKNLEGYSSRLTGLYYENRYKVNGYWHRLYGESYYYRYWNLNGKSFEKFKEVNYDS